MGVLLEFLEDRQRRLDQLGGDDPGQDAVPHGERRRNLSNLNGQRPELRSDEPIGRVAVQQTGAALKGAESVDQVLGRRNWSSHWGPGF